MTLFPIMAVGLSAVLLSSCDGKQETPPTESPPGSAVSESAPHTPYPQVLQAIEAERERLAAAYRDASSASAKKRVLIDVREALFPAICDDLIPLWYGTPWDFNGTTQVPGEGKIACGYFVSTVLRDAGFQVGRVRLAQQASELIVKSLVAGEHIRRFSNTPVDQFIDAIESWGEGFYVVGLDFHVGFIVHDDEGIHFVHSSYGSPREVVREDAARSAILASSEYRVLGKLSGDDELLVKWLCADEIQTRLR